MTVTVGRPCQEATPGTIWLPPERLDTRREIADGALSGLVDSLQRELAPALATEIVLPLQKARLSREGGRCAVDGTFLRFDPFSPRRHRCPRCGAIYEDEAHHRWWIMGFHLWAAERAVHGAVLHALRGDDAHREFVHSLLSSYSDAYPRYPNSDNVLGPSRPFFSTYLESLWLLHLCVALDILESVEGVSPVGDHFRENVIVPSARLIAGYDEGMSNRQVWNVAALMAARLSLGEREAVASLISGPSGLVAHLTTSLLADGSWYEGENYHQFAHRGLWYCIHLADAAGFGQLPVESSRRFQSGFAAPFATALPDLTIPARRDSQYGVSLRQWRFAEMAELGLARDGADGTLRWALARLYDGSVPAADSGRWRSTGEAERNEEPVALDRTSLGWKSVLFALPKLPELAGASPRSMLQEAQGLAIFRRRGGRGYTSLDYGLSGGGHGHPDRLNLVRALGTRRILDDPGTGSYVDPSLSWYRSTLAHCAPMVNGASQLPADGRLLAWDERGLVGWVSAAVSGSAPGVSITRSLVALDAYLVDELTWESDRDVAFELPIQADIALDGAVGWVSTSVDVEGASFLRDVERIATTGGDVSGMTWSFRPSQGKGPIVWVASDGPVDWWRAIAPGPPGRPPGRLHVARLHGRRGRLVTVWSEEAEVRSVALNHDVLTVELPAGERHEHGCMEDGSWRVGLYAAGATSSIQLAGPVGSDVVRMESAGAPGAPGDTAATASCLPAWQLGQPFRAMLGAVHYRRSELPWEEAGRPGAMVELRVEKGRLLISVQVTTPSLAPGVPGATNDMDNERPEVNADGVQLHLALPALATAARPAPFAGWLLAPREGGTVDAIPLDPVATGIPISADWERSAGGYLLRAALGVPDLARDETRPVPISLDLLVNLTLPGRERRSGQLVLSGAEGEFVYLRGDRHDISRCLQFLLPDA